MLKKDSRMYQDRMEDILKQMEQVIEERNKVNIDNWAHVWEIKHMSYYQFQDKIVKRIFVSSWR